MRTNVVDEMHNLSHDDELRNQLLMRYLQQIEKEKKQRGFLRRFKKQWEAHSKSIEAERETNR